MQAKIVRSDDTFRMQFCGGDTGTLIMTRARRRLQQTAALVSLPCWCLTHHAATTVDSEDFLPHATLQVCCLDSRGGISGAHSLAVSTFPCRREGVIGSCSRSGCCVGVCLCCFRSVSCGSGGSAMRGCRCSRRAPCCCGAPASLLGGG